MLKVDENSAQVRFPPPLVYLGFILLGVLGDRVLDLAPLVLPGLEIVGGIVLVAGLGVIAAGLGAFFRKGNNPEPWKEDTVFVAEGVYGYTRNPMYLGMALAHLGIALALRSTGALAMLPAALIAIDRFVIAKEERYLRQRFGAEYGTYLTQTRRWL